MTKEQMKELVKMIQKTKEDTENAAADLAALLREVADKIDETLDNENASYEDLNKVVEDGIKEIKASSEAYNEADAKRANALK